jgi:hypothetical protein
MKKYNYISSKLIEHEQASALSMQELRESERERERRIGADLATDDGNRGKRVPESRQRTAFSVVTERGTSSLDFVHQRDQVLHFRSELPLTTASDSDRPDPTASEKDLRI